MAHHVTVGVVADDEVVAAAVDSLHQLVGHFGRTHLGLEIVGGNVWRRHHDAFFARKGVFPSTAEKEGDVGVFFGLGNAQLGLALLGQVGAEHVVEVLGRKRAGCVDIRGVLGGSDEAGELRHVASLETVKGGVGESAGELARTVRAEVHEQYAVAIANRGTVVTVCSHGGGQHEFVVLVPAVGRRQASGRVGRAVCGTASGEELPRLLNALPAVVAIHCIVAPDDTRHAATAQLVKQRLGPSQRRLGAARRGIPPVEEGVQINPAGASRGGQAHGGENLVFVAVHTAGRKQP